MGCDSIAFARGRYTRWPVWASRLREGTGLLKAVEKRASLVLLAEAPGERRRLSHESIGDVTSRKVHQSSGL